jgi:septum site-determining protein MinD
VPAPSIAPPPAASPVELVGLVRGGESVARRYWRTARRALTGHHPSRELGELAAAVAVPLTTGRRIAVVSARGGAGKSAVTALLASVCAARRADPVLAADADPACGSLGWRLGLPGGPGLGELAPHLLAGEEPARFLPRTEVGLFLLPGAAAPHLVRDVTRALSRTFAVCVTDCGPLGVPATGGILAEAHAVVVVCPATPDGVRSTCDLLARWPRAALARVAVALNAASPGGRAALRPGAARAALGRWDVPLVALPYDRHVAGAAPIRPGRIAEPTLVAASRLAARALVLARPL